MVVLTSFLEASRAVGRNGKDELAEKLLVVGGGEEEEEEEGEGKEKEVEEDEEDVGKRKNKGAYYFAFHAAHVKESKDNLTMNSWCLPVYALPLKADKAVLEASSHDNRHSLPNPTSLKALFFSYKQWQNDHERLLRSIKPQPTSNIVFTASKTRGGNSRKRDASTLDYRSADINYIDGDSGYRPKRGVVHDEQYFETYEGFDPRDHDIGGTGGRRKRKKSSNSPVQAKSKSKAKTKTTLKATTKATSKPKKNKPAAPKPAFPDLIGVYKYFDKLRVKKSKSQVSYKLSQHIKLNDVGTITSLSLDGIPAGAASGLQKLQLGDKLRLPSASVGEKPESYIDSNRRLVFFREHQKFISDLQGVNGNLVHPTRLYDAVQSLGGFHTTDTSQGWRSVLEKLGLPKTAAAPAILRKAYTIYFLSGGPGA